MSDRNKWMDRGLYRAAERVGHTATMRLTWLLNLVQLEPEVLAQRDPSETLDEIAFFALSAGGVIENPKPHLSMKSIDREFLVDVRNGLEDLRNRGTWVLHKPEVNLIAALDKDAPMAEGRPAALFTWQASRLINEHRGALHQCARCKRWFIASRPFQKYHSEACGRVVHNRAYQTKLRSATLRKVTTHRPVAASKP
jgi:hypothetical protein